jgi:hypothetical protein
MPKFNTTAAYISGAICGHLWMPETMAGTPFHGDVRQQLARFSDKKRTTLRTVLLHMLMEHGGDFQNAEFTADTVLRIERRAIDGAGMYRVHVFEREVSALLNCSDLVNAEAYTGDFLGEG